MLPKITIIIPLYKSGRFIDNIIGNIECLRTSNIEVIISDRHCFDNTIVLLEKYFKKDSRIRFLKSNDEIDWVTHINLLLVEARGELVRILPHDDISSEGSLESLIDALESDNDAVLAYGSTKALSIDDVPIPEKDRLSPHPESANDGWTLDLVLQMFWKGYFDGAFKGVIRREILIKNNLLINKTKDNIFPERCWLFALSLLGKFHFVPGAIYLKRFHSSSVTSQWEIKGHHFLSAANVMSNYLFRFINNDEAWQYGVQDIWLNARNLANWTTCNLGNGPVYQQACSKNKNQIRSMKLPFHV